MSLKEQWKSVLLDIVYKNFSDCFTFKDLFDNHRDEIVRRTQTKTKPKNLRNVTHGRLQGIRDAGWLKYVDYEGSYRVTEAGKEEYERRKEGVILYRSPNNNKETWCKKAIETYFRGFIFNKARITKFVNIETNCPLELDLYNRELMIAVEYNETHEKFSEYLHKTKENFEKLQCRDLIKQDYCQIYGVSIVIVPGLDTYEEINKHIKYRLKKQRIPRRNLSEELDEMLLGLKEEKEKERKEKEKEKEKGEKEKEKGAEEPSKKPNAEEFRDRLTKYHEKILESSRNGSLFEEMQDAKLDYDIEFHQLRKILR